MDSVSQVSAQSRWEREDHLMAIREQKKKEHRNGPGQDVVSVDLPQGDLLIPVRHLLPFAFPQ